MKNYHIRSLMPGDQTFLWEMLYHSLYVSEDGAPFDRNVVNQPEIARYVKDWGRPNDSGFVAVDEANRPLGAIWLRLFSSAEKGFGYINDQTPELGMAVLTGYQGHGIGTKLLSRLMESARKDFESISLSVVAENPAVRLYLRLGFEVAGKNGTALTMLRKLRA
jgi:ribosomal protein S18 acetylase RimI-like enzyme